MQDDGLEPRILALGQQPGRSGQYALAELPQPAPLGESGAGEVHHVVEATGEGIGGVVRDAGHASAEAQDRWTLTEVTDLPGYAACVAAEGAGWQLVRRTMTDGKR